MWAIERAEYLAEITRLEPESEEQKLEKLLEQIISLVNRVQTTKLINNNI
jgi:Asp-tRNA(Asn)/Glu-tRNA(Gln) amidotransferase C subunit